MVVEAHQKLDNCSIKKYSSRCISGVSPWQPCLDVRKIKVVKATLMPDKLKAAVQTRQLLLVDAVQSHSCGN